MSDFEPASGYSKNRTSTVFTDGENEQRAEFTYGLSGDWEVEHFDADKTSIVARNGSDEQRAVVVWNLNGTGGGDQHNMGWFATPDALREAYPTANDGDFAIVGSTDTVWVWDSDTTDWKDSGIQPTNNYNDLTNKPQINGVTLSGNKTAADLGIKGSVQISVEDTATVQGYVVPKPTAEEMTAIYNAIVAGSSVHIVDSNDVYYQVLQADSIDGAINIEIMYFSEMSILYSLENDTVNVTGKKLQDNAMEIIDWEA